MATDPNKLPSQALSSTPALRSAYTDSDSEGREDSLVTGAPHDHTLGDYVAAVTETPAEADIDTRMGLRGAPGRRPIPEDFEPLLTPEGNSGDIVGSDVSDNAFTLGEDGSTLIP